jgi:hypothetical protein
MHSCMTITLMCYFLPSLKLTIYLLEQNITQHNRMDQHFISIMQFYFQSYHV